MPALLTAASTMTCPHGGTVTAIPGSIRVSAGAPVLRASDTFMIAGCPFTTAAPQPCLSVQWVVTAQRVQHGGALVLTESSVGLCLNAVMAPQGTVLVIATQPKASGL